MLLGHLLLPDRLRADLRVTLVLLMQPGLERSSRSLMLLVRLLCVLLPLVVLVATAQMHLESLWQEGSLTVVAREESPFAVVCEGVLAEVIERLVGARVLLDSCHHLIKVSWGLG